MDVQQGSEKNAERAEKKFTSMDKDSNGSLSKEEYTGASDGEKEGKTSAQAEQ
jgi:hypothetical protein